MDVACTTFIYEKKTSESILQFIDEMANNLNGTEFYIFIRQLVQRLGLSGTHTENIFATNKQGQVCMSSLDAYTCSFARHLDPYLTT